jgi:hypothetical protein
VSEYRLEAVGEAVSIPDLGVRLSLNEVVWVSKTDLQASECLQALVRLGKVRVSSGARSRVSKEAPKKRLPTAVLRSRPNGRAGDRKAPPAAPSGGLTPEEARAMADRAAKKAVAEAAAQFQQILSQVVAPAAPAPQGDITEAVAAAVAQALQGAAIAPARPASSDIEEIIAGGPDEPLFIPSGIVKDQTESLTVSSESSTSGGLDDAANALKALRKNK